MIEPWCYRLCNGWSSSSCQSSIQPTGRFASFANKRATNSNSGSSSTGKSQFLNITTFYSTLLIHTNCWFLLGSFFQSSSSYSDTSSFFSIIWICRHTSSSFSISCLCSKISSTQSSCTTSALSRLSPRTVKLSVERARELWPSGRIMAVLSGARSKKFCSVGYRKFQAWCLLKYKSLPNHW